jgi:hypothetical protein
MANRIANEPRASPAIEALSVTRIASESSEAADQRTWSAFPSAPCGVEALRGDVDLGDREVPATLVDGDRRRGISGAGRPIRSASTMPRSSISTSSMRTRFMRRCRPTSRSGSPRRWWGCSCTSSTGSQAGRFSGFTTSSQRSGRPGRGSRSRTIAPDHRPRRHRRATRRNDVIGDRVVGDLDVERVPRPSRVRSRHSSRSAESRLLGPDPRGSIVRPRTAAGSILVRIHGRAGLP